ncbi:MAG TPA: hypothetical protein VNG69_13425 [Casimicrobiaceae bacterium]|nr:hypothetical protein [Casimicrobiaceae bacterium]
MQSHPRSAPRRAIAAFAFLLLAAPARAVDMIEYYHAGLDHYFITRFANEIQDLDSGTLRGWVRTGQSIQVFDAGDSRLAGSLPVCRFYGNPARGLDSHFYSLPAECAEVKVRFGADWLLESDDVMRVHPVDGTGQCPANTKPVYRLWNQRRDVNHRYTTDATVVDAMLAKGYRLEGIGSPRPVVFCAANIASASQAPACTVAASSTSLVLGAALSLSANCNGAPTRYEWLQCSALTPDACIALSECASATTSCAPVGRQQGSVLYTLRASNGGGTGRASVSVTWLPANTLPSSCALTASSTSLAVNSTLTLTASCTNGPTAYTWTGCTSSTSVCTISESTVGARTYAVSARNAAGAGTPASVIVAWQAPVTSLPVCTLTASPTSPFAGSFATLTANCSQTPTSYSFVNCSEVSGNTCRASNASTGPVTYSVTASNSLGTSAPASITLNWENPPPGGADLCGGYSQVKRFDLIWGGHINTNDPGGGFKADGVLVLRLVVPPNATGTSIPGVVSAVEFAGDVVPRIMSLSTSACDFRGFVPGVFPTPDPTGATRPMAWGFGVAPNTQFGLVGMAVSAPKLAPGQVYYVNIRNREYSNGQLTCAAEECNMRITVREPQ